MEFTTITGTSLGLEMRTVEHYRNLADSYRCSEQYIKMIGLYPALQISIKECTDEDLIQ